MAHQHGHHHDEDWHFEGPEEVARITRDGQVALPFVGLVVEALAGQSIRRVLDVGPGSGVGTCELARLLPAAELIALEPSVSMGAAVSERAESLGVSDRVTVRRGGLPDGLIGIEDIDLVWASMSLHHVGDEVGALQALREVLVDGGALALIEFGDPNQVLPDLGIEGFEERLGEAYRSYFSHMRHTLTDEVDSEDLADMVTRAGFSVVRDSIENITYDVPLTDDQRAYVVAWAERTMHQLDDSLLARDLQGLKDFVDDPNRPDGPITISRRVLIARN